VKSGNSDLFDDHRLISALTKCDNLEGMEILELSSNEGGHIVFLESKNPKSIVSIEANKRAFLKCLIIKEIVELKNKVSTWKFYGILKTIKNI